MAHKRWRDMAESYALGVLEGEELNKFHAHLAADCSVCKSHISKTAEALALIPTLLEPITPASSLKRRVLDQIEAEHAAYVFTRAEEGRWRPIGAGVDAKILRMDGTQQRVTALVRMTPGSRYSNHRHTQTEEIFVLEGSCYFGARLLRQGDYHRAEVGSIHVDMRSDEGSLMLIMAALHNEMLT